jgi:hypothetical protein
LARAGAPLPSRLPALPRAKHAFALTAVAVPAVALAGGVAAGDPEGGLALAMFLGFALFGFGFPFATVLVLVFSAWIPESVFGAERDVLESLGGLGLSSMRLLGALVGLSLALAMRRSRLLAVPLPRFGLAGVIALMGLLAWLSLSLLWAPDRLEGLRELAKLALPMVVGGIVITESRSPLEIVRALLVALALAMVAALIFAVIALFDRDLLPKEDVGWVPDAFPWASSLTYGILVGILGLIALSLAEHGVGSRRGLGSLSALAFVQIPFTLKRIAVGSAGLAVTLMMLAAGARRALAPLGVIAAAAVLLLFPPLVESNERFDEEGGIQFQGREYIWEQALENMDGADFAIGRGVNAYVAESAEIQRPGSYFQLHSEPLRVLYEGGGIGVVLAAAAFGLLVLSLVGVARAAPTGTVERALGEAGLGVLLFLLVTGLTDNTLDNYLLTSAGAIVVAAALRAAKPSKRGSPSSA